MGNRKLFLLVTWLFAFHSGDGCQMTGVGNWLLPVTEQIYDIQSGVFFNRSTTNIEGINGDINTGEGVNAALYLRVGLDEDLNFYVTTTDAFELYEEYETTASISFSVNFRCTGGVTDTLVFDVLVIDTNNNAPDFRPSDQYEFTITPPLPPGFQITGCADDNIIVRDIDLTTERIDFTLQDNPYFEIVYGGRSTADPKEFLAQLRTKDLIRSLPEVVELTVSATDVDRTGDPAITTNGLIRIRANEDFQFPDELVFSQPFYLATYTETNLIIQGIISLQQGFDSEVIFTLEGDDSEGFTLIENGNEISISVTTPLPTEIMLTGRIVLVVRAERQHTSGATATVIVQLPEVPELQFEDTHYEGRIVDNVLEPILLSLQQGYESGFTVVLLNEHASFFSTNVQGNVISLQMTALEESIIDTNNFISLRVVASNQHSSATAIVTLDIIKNDNTTPVFGQAVYIGEYDSVTGMTHEEIALVQGYEDGVSFTLRGEHASYFQLSNDGPEVVLASSGIPEALWVQQQLLLTIEATKLRSVPATTAISIRLPAARELSFELDTYRGTLQDNILNLQPIILSSGFTDGGVMFEITGDYSTFFNLSSSQSQVTINLVPPVPEDVILENNVLTLTVSASGPHAIPTSTAVVIEIIKQDVTTPVFTQNIYRGTYLGASAIEIGDISLAQGFDTTVTFRLDGEHSEYFNISNTGTELSLELQTGIPTEVIFREKVLLFSVVADKPLTVGGTAAVSITFPQELTDATVMRFAQNTYVGSLEKETLTLADIVLETGYEDGTNFILTGEHASSFSMQNTANTVLISVDNVSLDELIEDNKFIVLELEANRERAVSTSASIVIEIIKEVIIPPVFNESFYRGVYAENELQFDDVISLEQGYDETVSFVLDGAYSIWFAISQDENRVTLTRNNVAIPEEVLDNYNQLLFTIKALKPESVNGVATISIDLPKEIPEPVIMRFTQSSYVGSIDNGELYAPTITLLGDRDPIQLSLTGEYSSYFEVSHVGNDVRLQSISQIPEDQIEQLPFIILGLQASYPEAVNGYTAVVLEIIKRPQIVTPVFDQAYYVGKYSEQGGLTLDQSIQLIQGFDESVLFTLSGDDAQWFELVFNEENGLTLNVRDTGVGQIRNRGHLVFSVLANKAGSVPGRAAVIINLTDLTTTVPLRFLQIYYRGSIENNNLIISNFNLEEGYIPEINVSFIGDHADYFQLTNQEGLFTLQLLSDLPADIIEANNVLVFTLEAQIDDTRAHSTVILELVKTQRAPLAFEEAYYVGLYSIISGFTFDHQITLTEHDETVSFSLEGVYSEWFGIIVNQNSVSLVQENPIPLEVLTNNGHLVFVIAAERSDNIVARSTIIISIIEDTTVLGFERNVYLGSIHNDETNIDTIVVNNGFSESVSFSILGELQNYFAIVQDGSSVSIILQERIPEETIPVNRLISLELQASAPQAISAYATLVFGIIEDNIDPLIFSETYYTGRYSEAEGLDFQVYISLSQGYNDNVQFTLEGDDSQYFEATTTANNLVTLQVPSPIPLAVLLNNHHLIFTIRADKPNTAAVRVPIVISLLDVNLEEKVLRFNQVAYQGSLENDNIALEQIVLNEGFSPSVSFALVGDSNSYFTVSNDGEIVTITLENEIPEDLIPDNKIILLELQASAPQMVSAFAAIVLNVADELKTLKFEQIAYIGTIERGESVLEPVILSQGHADGPSFTLHGDFANYFSLEISNATVTITLQNQIPEESLPSNRLILIELQAFVPNAISARTAIIFKVLEDDFENIEPLTFSAHYYTGHYTEADGLDFKEEMTLASGFNEHVVFELEGDSAQYFEPVITGSSVSLRVVTPIPQAIISNNQQLIFLIRAGRTGAITARATIVISLFDEVTEDIVLGFDLITYQGTVEGTSIDIDPIELSEGYNENVNFILHGALSSYFSLSSIGSTVTITLPSPIPDQSIPDNQIIVLQIQARQPQVLSAYATIVLEVVTPTPVQLVFSHTYYTGHYIEAEGLTLDDTIILSEGFDENVQFALEGDDSQYFAIIGTTNAVSLGIAVPIPPAIVTNNQQLIFTIRAEGQNAITTRATIVISLVDEPTEEVILGFSRISYTGLIENDVANTANPIILSEGFSEDVTFILHGDLVDYFALTRYGAMVEISLLSTIPDESIPTNRIVILELQAIAPQTMSAFTTIVFEVVQQSIEELVFSEPYYTGQYTEDNELIFMDPISLSQGFDGSVQFSLDGEQSQWFHIEASVNEVLISLSTTVPDEVIENNRKLIFVIIAVKPNVPPASATIIISIYTDAEDCRPDDGARFERILFEGRVQGGSVQHETIGISGFTGTNVQVLGEYADLFEASYDNNLVVVQEVAPVALATDILYVPLELRAGSANTVLLLDIIHNGEPTLPLVEFSSASYTVLVDVIQIGLIGRVQATADNGESVTYSLAIENEHLQQRVSINEDGELLLSAPVNSGAYTFNVIATTVFTRATGIAPVNLAAESITESRERGLPPLVILDRDEESPHQNLVVLDPTEYPGCRYQLNNRWPLDQSWLYVDENGLHTTEIDREHESIAFMALSQVQVELILECDSNGATQTKRSVSTRSRLDHLGPYDYGDNKWILTDSMDYSPRRTLVNLIVNDINDNTPIFIGKENEPIVVGYPIADIEETILPRALAEVKATDADVGENAALVYWSSNEVVAVSPTSGLVHVRHNAQLEDGAEITVHATDLNGHDEGLTGSLDLLVKLVDTNHIAVVTVRQAFLEDESRILANISTAVGYEVKALKSAVISDAESEDVEQRQKREAVLSTGASLQLYVYGLIQRDPVLVQRLTDDIRNSAIAAISIVNTVSLEDHLESLEICSVTGHDTGLLVATIVLSVLLFILIVAAAVWFFLKWRQSRKYQQFEDDHSVESPKESVATRPKPIVPVVVPTQPVATNKPRINMEELKKSERRLQEMLEAPVEEITIQPIQPLTALKTPVAKLNMPEPPIVIQSIDKLKDMDDSEDDDEYGERAKGRRKSVVTFNENVEKIIHVEDSPDDDELEVYKL